MNHCYLIVYEDSDSLDVVGAYENLKSAEAVLADLRLVGVNCYEIITVPFNTINLHYAKGYNVHWRLEHDKINKIELFGFSGLKNEQFTDFHNIIPEYIKHLGLLSNPWSHVKADSEQEAIDIVKKHRLEILKVIASKGFIYDLDRPEDKNDQNYYHSYTVYDPKIGRVDPGKL